MKKLIFSLSVLTFVFVSIAQIQTNTFVTNMVSVPKQKITACGPTYWRDGEATPFKPAITWGYRNNTNVLTFTFTNASARIEAGSLFGIGKCGTSPLVVTDTAYPGNLWRMSIDRNTNSEFANGPVGLVCVGLTNTP